MSSLVANFVLVAESEWLHENLSLLDFLVLALFGTTYYFYVEVGKNFRLKILSNSPSFRLNSSEDFVFDQSLSESVVLPRIVWEPLWSFVFDNLANRVVLDVPAQEVVGLKDLIKFMHAALVS